VSRRTLSKVKITITSVEIKKKCAQKLSKSGSRIEQMASEDKTTLFEEEKVEKSLSGYMKSAEQGE
jgi:hypothetical protein